MSFTFAPFDKQGVLQLRTFPDTAHLPATPPPGELCVVDDGTVATLYQSLRSGSTTGWFIVASPVPPAILLRDDPSDSRKSQYSTDDGTTWADLAFFPPDAVTTAPVSGENSISSSGSYYALQVYNDNNFAALGVGAIGGPAIVAKVEDGTGDAPAIRLVSTDPTNVSDMVEFAYEGGANLTVLNRYGAIVAQKLTALPTASIYWWGALVRVISDTADDVLWYCQRQTDGVFAWVQVYPPIVIPPAPGRYYFNYPDALPAPGNPAFSFTILLPSGLRWYFPWVMPTGYMLTVSGVRGVWGEIGGSAGTTQYGAPAATGGDPTIGGSNWLKIFYQEYAHQGDDTPIGTGFPTDTTLFTANGAFAFLESNPGTISEGATTGIVEAVVTITPPTTSVSISYDDGTGPATASIGDSITITPSVFTAFGGYSQFVAHFSTLSTWQWVSGDVLQRPTNSCDFCWNADNNPSCGGAADHYYLDPVQSDNGVSSINSHQGESHQAVYMSSTDGNAAGPFVLKLISIP